MSFGAEDLVDFVPNRQNAKIELARLFEGTAHFDPLMNCTFPIVWTSARAGCTVWCSPGWGRHRSPPAQEAVQRRGRTASGVVESPAGAVRGPGWCCVGATPGGGNARGNGGVTRQGDIIGLATRGSPALKGVVGPFASIRPFLRQNPTGVLIQTTISRPSCPKKPLRPPRSGLITLPQ